MQKGFLARSDQPKASSTTPPNGRKDTPPSSPATSSSSYSHPSERPKSSKPGIFAGFLAHKPATTEPARSTPAVSAPSSSSSVSNMQKGKLAGVKKGFLSSSSTVASRGPELAPKEPPCSEDAPSRPQDAQKIASTPHATAKQESLRPNLPALGASSPVTPHEDDSAPDAGMKKGFLGSTTTQ